ncbi:MAG TPA: HEAT repeat domain-containing protein [Candidatus Binatia bacterium]|nr:HEAT repeat domain-containing protein [Candidatus Binatia bacterium]
MKKCLIVLAIALGVGAGVLTLPSSDGEDSERRQMVHAYLRALAGADYEAREDARAALGRIGQEATPFLIAELKDRPGALDELLFGISRRFAFVKFEPSTTPQLRARAAEQLAALTPTVPAEAVRALVRAFADPDSAVVEESQRSLRRIGPVVAVPELIAALSARNYKVRRHAAEVLRDFGPAAARATAALLKSLGDQRAIVRVQAAYALARVGGTGAVSGLSEALNDRNPAVRAGAAEAIGYIGADASGVASLPLRGCLGDSNVRVRVCAARALWLINRDASAAVPVLAAALREPGSWEAALALGAMGSAASNAVPALVETLKREKVPRPLRETPVSALALGHIGGASVPALIDTLANAEPRVRTSAALALGFVGAKASSATKQLVALLSDRDGNVRRAATLSLGSIDPGRKELVPALLVMANDEDVFLSSLASSTLERIDPDAAASVRRE